MITEEKLNFKLTDITIKFPKFITYKTHIIVLLIIIVFYCSWRLNFCAVLMTLYLLLAEAFNKFAVFFFTMFFVATYLQSISRPSRFQLSL